MRINWDSICERRCAVLSSSFDYECCIVVVYVFFTVLAHLQVFLNSTEQGSNPTVSLL